MTLRSALAGARNYAASNLPCSDITVIATPLAAAWLLASLQPTRPGIAVLAVLTLAAAGFLARAHRRPRLRVLYSGGALTVDEDQIQPHMDVPLNRGPYGDDENFGATTVEQLFSDAVSAGAIRVPPQLRVKCIANETNFCDVMLIAAAADGRARVCTDWFGTASLGVSYSEEAHDASAVTAALTVLVDRLNDALSPH